MISRATMNLKPAVIELDLGPSSKRPFWIRSGCVCAVHSLMSALGQKRTCAMQEPMSALPPIATAKADFRKPACPLYPQKRTCAVQLAMSALGQKRTFRHSFHDFIGARPAAWGH